jgi:hypothetical protein
VLRVGNPTVSGIVPSRTVDLYICGSKVCGHIWSAYIYYVSRPTDGGRGFTGRQMRKYWNLQACQ